MNKYPSSLIALAVMAFTLMISSSAQAQATRTWVSGVGDDVNPCSRTAPCKTYAGAISKTAAGGEISTLDPGGFGAVTITKSMTIDGTTGQGFGSILACGTNGVIVNDSATATPGTIKVKLRNLSINGCRNTTSPGLDGIRFISGASLHVEDTVIDGFSGDGIDVSFSIAVTADFILGNVVIRDCGGAGVRMNANSTGATAFSFRNISVTKCGTGIDAQNGSRGSMRDGTFGRNTTGIALSQGSSLTEVNIEGTLFTGNGTAISPGAGTRARIARTTIAQNNVSMTAAAQVDTGGNNTIFGNSTNTAPAGTAFPQN